MRTCAVIAIVLLCLSIVLSGTLIAGEEESSITEHLPADADIVFADGQFISWPEGSRN